MATRDILVLNTTASRAETQQGSDTVVIRGNSGEALSVENSSGTSILSVNTVSSSVDVAGKITATGNISSSLSSTGSFGRVEATTLVGDAFNLSNTEILGTISSSGQIANQISGAFRQGFEFEGTIGSVAGHTTTASFDQIVATVFSGSAANLINTVLEGTLSSSAQIASEISGAFTSGFEFDGTISGSATSTGSFGRIDATTLIGDVSQMSNLVKTGLVSGSAQIASQISGSFNKGFEFDGHISGSAVTTASFANVFATKAVGDISSMYNLYPDGIVTEVGVIATQISRSFAHTGFEFDGTISGSATSTGSFHNVFAKTIHGDISNLTNIFSEVVSGSKQIASNISGSFNKGFEFSGTIQTSPAAWSTAANMPANFYGGAGAGRTQNAALHWSGRGPSSNSTSNCSVEWNGTSWSATNNFNKSFRRHSGAGNTESALSVGGYSYPNALESSEYFNGTNWSEKATLPHRGMDGATVGEDADILLVGGGDHPGVSSANTDKYSLSGNAWSQESDAPTNVGGEGAAGTSEAAIIPLYSPSEGSITYNGSNWSEIASTLTNRGNGVGIFGTQNNAVAVGGCANAGASRGCTEIWNGTSWTYGSAMNNGRTLNNGRTVGTAAAGLAFSTAYQSVSGPAWSCDTEIWNDFISTGSFNRLEVKTLTGDGSNLTGTAIAGTVSGSGQLATQISGSFTSGFTVGGDITNVQPTFAYAAGTSNLSSARWRGASGIKTAGLAFGGQTPTRVGDTETFDGTTWTEVNNLNTNGPTVGGGTTNATVAFGGWYRGRCTETWDGTSWSEVNDLITSRDSTPAPIKLSHSQNAALAAGAVPGGSPSVATEEWNGTNWSTSNDLIKGMKCADGFGTPAGGVAIGTAWPSAPNDTNAAVLWNGVNWSEGPVLPQTGNNDFNRMTNAGTAGAENDGIVAGQCQYQLSIKAGTVCYNGITFNLGNDLPTGCAFHRGAGTNVANAWFVGGQSPSAPYYPSPGFTVSSGIASASFSHIDALRITASVDLMTNIPEPSGTISGSAQIASYVSGSFNKGFEFSGEIKSLGVWSAGGDFPGHTNSTQHSAVYGTQNAALLGGGMGYYQASKCDTYTYNGTSWSDTGANMIEARGGYSGIGTQDAALAAGGNPYKSHIFQYLRSFTEEWNGSAWSETTNLPHQLTFINHQSAGTQNAGLIAGGYTGAGAVNQGSGSEAFQKTSLAWDGLSYSIIASMDNERANGGVVGSMNSALAQGGSATFHHSTCTEEWNGSAWSDAAASNFPTAFTSTVGTSNNAMHTVDASSPVRTGCTDFYNGVSWSTGPLAGLSNPSTYKQCTGAAGSTSAGLFITFNSSCVEHFDENHVTSSIGRVDVTELSLESDTDLTVNESLQIPQYATNPPVTSSAGEVWYNTAEEKLYFTYDINSWTDITGMIQGRDSTGIVGSTGEALVAGGRIDNSAPYQSTCTELWNGTSWTALNAIGEAQSGESIVGTACAAFQMSATTTQTTEGNVLWNGTNWSAGPDGGLGVGGHKGTGTANASIHTGGSDGSGNAQDDTSEWNGTSFYVGGLMPGNRTSHCQAGTQNTAYVFGGANPGLISTSDKYNGTSWSTDVNIPVALKSGTGTGTSNAAIGAGGRAPSNTPSTFEYNGTAWTTTVDLNRTGNALFNTAMTGNQASALAVGGYGKVTCSETYTTTGIGCHCIGGV